MRVRIVVPFLISIVMAAIASCDGGTSGTGGGGGGSSTSTSTSTSTSSSGAADAGDGG